MSARILDGTAVARQIREELRPAVEAFTSRAGRPPGLGIVLVGDDPGSTYVSSKLEICWRGWPSADLHWLPCRSTMPRTL